MDSRGQTENPADEQAGRVVADGDSAHYQGSMYRIDVRESERAM